jgi:hypothetical protein
MIAIGELLCSKRFQCIKTGRARRQVEGRRWIHPEGTEQSIVFNVTGQGVKDVQKVGAQLRTLLEENHIRYDRIYVQDGADLTEIP